MLSRKRFLRPTGIILALCLALTALTGCRTTGRGYRVIDTYYSDSGYSVAFREGDEVATWVIAAMQYLAASGNMKAASLRWFGENLIAMKGDEDALAALGTPEHRTLIVGADMDNLPMSYTDGVYYYGFDMEMASDVCGLLGWTLQVYPIETEDMDIELSSGNIDCAWGIPENYAVSGYDYSPAYVSNRYLLVSRLEFGIRSSRDLKGGVLGVQLDDLSVLDSDERFRSSLDHIVYESGNDGLFQLLDSGEVDAILVSSTAAYYYMS